MNGEAVSFKFDGQVEEVDINTFTHVMINYAKVVEAAAKEVDENAPVRINVRAVNPGCLDVIIGIVQENLGPLFQDPVTTVNTVAAIVNIAGDVYKFKKHLGKNGKVKEAKAVDASNSVSITTENGAVTLIDKRTYNIYVNSPEVSKAVNSSFEILDNDERIDSLTMSKVSSGEKLFSATHNEFSEIASSPSYEDDSIRHIVSEETLIVIKPVLEKTSRKKWEFLWNNITIKAAIADKAFIENLDTKTFGIGSTMKVNLDKTQEYSEELGAYKNVKYEVKQVFSVSNKPENLQLF